MSLTPCKFYDIRSGTPILIGDIKSALEWLVKNPDVMANPFISKVRKSFQSALDKLGLKANVEFISDKEAEGIVSDSRNKFQIIGETGAAMLENAEMVLADLGVAEKLEKKGKDAKTIRFATGWERGADGKWRYEIMDGKLKTKPSSKDGKLSDFFESEELFKAYPSLKNINVKLRLNGLGNGSFSDEGIRVDGGLYDMESILIHEIQHAIQEIEGFARGGSPDNFRTNPNRQYELEKDKDIIALEDKIDKLVDSGSTIGKLEKIGKSRNELNIEIEELAKELKDLQLKKYKRLAGEVEAKNVQARMNMTPAERKAKMLAETEDIAREDQIVLMDAIDTDKNTMYMRAPLAPNGKPSKLTPEQHRQVRTPEFKKWFGDWENDPENASQVVDENGEPLVVYHGTDRNVDVFNKENRRNIRSNEVQGYWFTDSKENAKLFSFKRYQDESSSPTIIGTFLNIRTPLDINFKNLNKNMTHSELDNNLSELAKRFKNDGVIKRGFKDKILSDNFVVFGPNQIKSATENVGTFSAESNDIRYMKDSKGTILGFVQPQPDGSYKVWIDPATTDAETPIHELAGHIFMPLLKEAAPELHARGIELIQNTPYLKAAEALGLEGDAASEEALAQAIGEKGKQLSESKRKGFIEWLNGMWQKVGEKLGISVPIKNLTLGEFTDLIAGSVLQGDKLKVSEAKPATKEALKESIAANVAKLNIQLGDLFKSDNRLGLAKMPEQAARELYEQHKALVETLKKIISDVSQIAKLSAEEFADLLGQKATNLFKSAYNAFKTGKTSYNDFLEFNEIEVEGESESGPEIGKSKLAVRAIEGETSEEFKERLEELGYAYEKNNPKKGAQIAKELIADFGWQVVLDKIRAGLIVGPGSTKAFADIIDIVGQKLIEAKTPAEFEAALSEQAALIKEFSLRGTQKGQEIQEIQDVLLNNDFNFSLAGMVGGYKDAGGVVTPEMMQKFKDLEQEIKDLTKKLAENEATKKELEEAAVLNAYAESQGRDDKRPQGIKDAAKAAANRIRKLKVSRPEYINAASPAIIAWDTAVEIVASSIEAGGNVAQAVEKGLKSLRDSKWYKSVSKDIQDKVDADFAAQNTDKATPEPEYIDNKVKVTKGAIAALVRQGYDTIDKVVDRVHEMLGQPDLTKRQIRDAITKYGQTINPTKDKIQQKVNELTRIGRKISQIEDARNKIRPLRSGLQRDKLVEEERRLQKELNQLLKALPPSEVDLSKAIKTATDAIKTRLKNQIEDLETQIKKKERVPPSQRTPRFSIEELVLKDQRDALQKTLDDLVGKPEISDEQKIQDAIEATEKSLAEYQRRINEMDFSSFGKPKGPESPELKKLREERDALREQYELLKKGPPKSEEQKKLERLQKELEDLRKNGLKDPKGKPIDSPAAKALKAQIEAQKKLLGRDKSYETALKIAQKKLQDLEDKITNKKLEIAKKIQKEQKGPELDAVRTQIENTEKTLKQLREDAGIIAKAKLDAWKKATKEATDKYNEKLRKGDFSTKSKEEIKLSELDEEGKKLLSEKIRAKEKYVKAVNEAKRNQEKITAGWIANQMAGTLRVLLASGEFSFVMIQNKLVASGLLFRNPKALLDTFKATLKAMASHRYSEGLVENIKSQDWYPEMKASGVTIIDDFTAESMKDETTHYTIAQTLWNMLERPIRLIAFGDINPIIKKDDVAHEIYKDANPLEAFERAANAFGNAMRVIEFLRGREMLIKKGITFEDNPEAYKQLGAGINTLTNRTSLGKYLEPGTPVWNVFLFSARNWASVLKNLPPISFFYYGSKMEGADMKSVTTPEYNFKVKGKDFKIPSKTFSVPTSTSPIQKMYLQDFMSFVALAGGTVLSFALYEALATMGDDDEEKEKYEGPKVESDLRSSGALKVKFGNQYLDVWGGYQQQIVLFTRIIADILIDQGYDLEGSYKSMTKGNISRLGESMYVPTKGDLMLNMVRNKLSPAAALGWDYAFSVLDTEEGTRELNGRQIDLQENFSANLKPMYWQAVKETAEEQPMLTAAFLDGIGFFGASINTLKEQTKTQAQQIEAKLNPNKDVKKAFNEALESGNIEKAKKAFNKITEKMPEGRVQGELADKFTEITNQNPIQNHSDEVASVVYGLMDDATIIQGDTVTTVRKLYSESELAFFKKKMDDFSKKQAKKVEVLDSIRGGSFFTEYFMPYNKKFGGELTETPVVKKQPSLTERTMKNLKILFK